MVNDVTVNKQELLDIISKIPNKIISIEEIIEALYAFTKIKQGLNDFQKGDFMSTEELLKEIETW